MNNKLWPFSVPPFPIKYCFACKYQINWIIWVLWNRLYQTNGYCDGLIHVQILRAALLFLALLRVNSCLHLKAVNVILNIKAKRKILPRYELRGVVSIEILSL